MVSGQWPARGPARAARRRRGAGAKRPRHGGRCGRARTWRQALPRCPARGRRIVAPGRGRGVVAFAHPPCLALHTHISHPRHFATVMAWQRFPSLGGTRHEPDTPQQECRRRRVRVEDGRVCLSSPSSSLPREWLRPLLLWRRCEWARRLRLASAVLRPHLRAAAPRHASCASWACRRA